ncbi:MAG: prephenate/arogenate dehydrogenase family protein [Alphaproteobacteria bacterium]|nr:prephenate/arogenate dehydrogenase family protein [Alphaproteobacteria bacterium]
MMSSHLYEKIAVIGLGLIGSSLIKATMAKNLAGVVMSYDRDDAVRATAQSLGLGEVTGSIAEAVEGADLVVLAIPVGAMAAATRDMAPHLKPGAVVTDTGSTKTSVIADVTPHLPDGVYFLPSHPIAGTEYSGPEAGFATLFQDRYWIILPQDAPDEVVATFTDFLSGLGAIVEEMDADYHDKVLAVTSHLPHLIAYTIVGTAADLEGHLKNDVIKFSASGFRDFTRIAASDPIMWRDVFINNADAVLEMLGRFNEDLSYLQRAIRWKESDKLEELFTRTRAIRKKIEDIGQLD